MDLDLYSLFDEPGFQSGAQALIDSPPAEPTPFEIQLFQDTVKKARGLGLPLPERLIARWRRGERDDAPHGCCTVENGEPVLYLNVHSYRLHEVIPHELGHAADFHTGAWSDLPKSEQERNADLVKDAILTDQRIPEGLFPEDDQDEGQATERAVPPTTAPRPMSVAPSGACRARYLLDQVQHRLRRLLRHIDGEDRLALRVVERHVLELGAIARRKA